METNYSPQVLLYKYVFVSQANAGFVMENSHKSFTPIEKYAGCDLN